MWFCSSMHDILIDNRGLKVKEQIYLSVNLYTYYHFKGNFETILKWHTVCYFITL